MIERLESFIKAVLSPNRSILICLIVQSYYFLFLYLLYSTQLSQPFRATFSPILSLHFTTEGWKWTLLGKPTPIPTNTESPPQNAPTPMLSRPINENQKKKYPCSSALNNITTHMMKKTWNSQRRWKKSKAKDFSGGSTSTSRKSIPSFWDSY